MLLGGHEQMFAARMRFGVQRRFPVKCSLERLLPELAAL